MRPKASRRKIADSVCRDLLTASDAAKKFGCTPETVKYACRKFNVRPVKRDDKIAAKAKAVADLVERESLTVQEAADRTSFSSAFIYKACRSRGIVFRNPINPSNPMRHRRVVYGPQPVYRMQPLQHSRICRDDEIARKFSDDIMSLPGISDLKVHEATTLALMYGLPNQTPDT